MRLVIERYLLIYLFLISILTACVPNPLESPLNRSSPTIIQRTEKDLLSLVPTPPIPESGKASISGLLYSITGDGPIPGTLYYLTPATEQGKPPNILVGPRNGVEIRGLSDERGRVVLNNIPPGRYYLVVWAPYNWILAVESEVNMTPRLIVLGPDQRVNLGIICLPWP